MRAHERHYIGSRILISLMLVSLMLVSLMLVSLMLAALALPHSAWATPAVAPKASSRASSRPEVIIQGLEEGADLSPFEGSGYKIQGPEKTKKSPSASKTFVPDPKTRDREFAKAGLLDPVAAWDELDKDTLYIRAGSLPLPELKKRYSQLSPTGLAKLKAQLEKSRGQ